MEPLLMTRPVLLFAPPSTICPGPSLTTMPRLLKPLLKVAVLVTKSTFCELPLLIGPLNTRLPDPAEPRRASVEMEMEFVMVRVVASVDSKPGNTGLTPRQS